MLEPRTARLWPRLEPCHSFGKHGSIQWAIVKAHPIRADFACKFVHRSHARSEHRSVERKPQDYAPRIQNMCEGTHHQVSGCKVDLYLVVWYKFEAKANSGIALRSSD